MLDPKIKERIRDQSQLPTHDDCEVKKKTLPLSALERFIWDQEPVDDGEFREQLKAAIIEARVAEAERSSGLVECLREMENHPMTAHYVKTKITHTLNQYNKH